jgi:hypothetical protein
VPQGIGPEFKPQYHKKRKKLKGNNYILLIFLNNFIYIVGKLFEVSGLILSSLKRVP